MWKDYAEMEDSLSMPELTSILSAKRDKEYEERRFLAAIQGIDLENETGGGGQKEWEDLKSKVFSGGQALDSDDILSLQGPSAAKAGFGIGAGLDYIDMKDQQPKNPFG